MRKRKRRAVAKPDNADGQTKKYGNKKVVYNGIKFDSEREGNRYLFLCEQQRQGLITDLWVHPKYELIPKVGHIETEQLKTKTKQKIVVDQLAITYTADFLYRKNGKLVVEDVKMSPYMIPEKFELKAKLLYWRYRIKIRLVFSETEPV